MQTWCEGMAKARDRIKALSQIIGPLSSLEALLDSERPAKGLLEDERVAEKMITHLSNPSSGTIDDPLCQWLYDTYLSGDLDLQAVVLRYVPALCGLYLPRVTSYAHESLAGFEAVLLALYSAETKARGGRPLVINIPDLSQPSLYHSPRIAPSNPSPQPRIGQLAPPLEPQLTIKATKRACIVGVALDLFCRRIAIMPRKAKVEACQCALRWASLSCSQSQVDVDASLSSFDAASSSVTSNAESALDGNPFICSPSPPSRQLPEIEIVGPGELFLGNKSPQHSISPHHHLRQNWGASPKRSPSPPSRKYVFAESPSPVKQSQAAQPQRNDDNSFEMSLAKSGNGIRIPLPWELLQPLIQLLGHCLLAPLNSQEVKEAASAAITALHSRVSHDLIPEAILATRSLMRLNMAAREAAKNVASSVNSTSTPSKPRKPEILLVSK